MIDDADRLAFLVGEKAIVMTDVDDNPTDFWLEWPYEPNGDRRIRVQKGQYPSARAAIDAAMVEKRLQPVSGQAP